MLLKKLENNIVALTLEENTTISNANYLFEFQNNTTKQKYFQIFTDVSTAGAARERANRFNINVVASGAGANEIVLGNVGLYNYTIYQQVSSVNLDPDLSGGVVERGQMRLIDNEDSIWVEHEIEITYIAHEQ
jgi:hypothetical protein